MAANFTEQIFYEGKSVFAVVLPTLRPNGMHYEVNIIGFPRFYMRWTELDRFDVVQPKGAKLPDGLVLAVSDAIEKHL